MLYNYLLGDVERKRPPLPKQNQHQRPEAMELVESPTTALPRPVTIYADQNLHTLKRDSASSKMNFKFPFTEGPLGSRSPAISQDPLARYSQTTTNRLTL